MRSRVQAFTPTEVREAGNAMAQAHEDGSLEIETQKTVVRSDEFDSITVGWKRGAVHLNVHLVADDMGDPYQAVTDILTAGPNESVVVYADGVAIELSRFEGDTYLEAAPDEALTMGFDLYFYSATPI